ncbi:MAG: hypothetical protein S4CHLAM81_00210 [Chlamydiales bacterium]|nr:hypothetical protein [Chlamydiales bacterium]MCH9634823.1 hypothetical protein [Chlamydiales bacterium]
MLSHRTLIFLAGTLWLIIGVSLLGVGLTLSDALPLFAAATAVGYAKGRFVMSKAARKQVIRIASLEAPTSIANLYSKPFYFLILGMMGLGMSLRFLPVPPAVRAFVDVAVGIALVIGAIQYYVSALRVAKA